MKIQTTAETLPRHFPSRGRRAPAWAARLVIGRLESIAEGELEITDSGARETFGHPSPDGLRAEVHVRDARFWTAVLLRGSVGAGEAWMQGWFTSPDLVAVLRLFVRNQAALTGVEGGAARLSRPFLGLWHRLRDNTRIGSRRNIAAHYDLSNEFFALFLDETMTYSCGIFERPDASLREASVAKIDRICRKLELSPVDHLLEIGTGWGALAVHAAREYGCRVTTTTISERQGRLAGERIRTAGLEDRIELLSTDYRDLRGRYDKLVSVEMIEAVGHRWFDRFFEACGSLLAPDGAMLLQAITIDERLYAAARDSVDFIKRYVFPGCCIPSVGALHASAARASDLQLTDLEDIGPHYVTTLNRWRQNLLERRGQVLALGLDERFVAMWEFYLAYCEGGFAERQLSDVQLLFTKPGARISPTS